MKNARLSFIFILLALSALALVPLHNLLFDKGHGVHAWWRGQQAYKLDFMLPYENRVLYAVGISSDPGQAMIGKEDWLYLGDSHRSAVSQRRFGASADDLAQAHSVNAAARSWHEWLAQQGVQAYRILICADKESIYPEFLPDWARPAPAGATDAFMQQAEPQLYLDSRPALRQAKSRGTLLYFKTDTHWNSAGAWVAFQQLSADLARVDPAMRQLSAHDVQQSLPRPYAGGDLARFIRLDGVLHEQVKSVDLIASRPTVQIDYRSGALLARGGNGELEAPKRPLLVRSDTALNKKRVLWLRDSFGRAMAPFMAATFSETLQVHYLNLDPAALSELVRRFKPDYVLQSVVERDLLDRHFTHGAPVLAPKEAQ